MYKIARKSNERKAVGVSTNLAGAVYRGPWFIAVELHTKKEHSCEPWTLFIRILLLTPAKKLDRDRFNLIAVSFDRKDTRNTLLRPIIQRSNKK